MPKKRRGSPRAYEIVRQPGKKNQKWARPNNPWFDPLFTGVKVTTPYDNLPKPLDPSFWDNIASQIQQTQAPSEYDLALQTIHNMKTHKIDYGNKSVGELASKHTDSSILHEGWSAFNWTMDKLSRPMYGVENVVLHNIRDINNDAKNGFQMSDMGHLVKNMLETTTPLGLTTGDFWKGFTGKEKVSGQKIAKAIGIDNKWAKGAIGFGIDMGADPLTYVPGGAILRAIRSGGRLAKGGKAAKAAEEAFVHGERDAIPTNILKEEPKTTAYHQPSMFKEHPVFHGPARAPKATEGPREFAVKQTGQTELLRPSGAAKVFNAKERTAAATVAAKLARDKAKQYEGVIAYPGKGKTLKAGQTFFKKNAEGKWKPTPEFNTAVEHLLGKKRANATAGEWKTAADKVRDRVLLPTDVKAWRKALKDKGIPPAMINKLEEEFGDAAKSVDEVKAALKPKVSLHNIKAASDEAIAVGRGRPAAEQIADQRAGDIFAKLGLDNAGNPLLSAAGHAATTGGGEIPIRAIEQLTDVERDIVHAAMTKHGAKALDQKAQADLVKHIRQEALDYSHKVGKRDTPKEVWNIINSATNAQALSRTALERFSREGMHAIHGDTDTAWNVLDIADMIGGRQGFGKLFGKDMPKGDVAYLHTLSKYATQTARYLRGEGKLPPEVRGKPGFINIVRQMMNAGEAATSLREGQAMQPILQSIGRAAREVAMGGGSSADVAAAIERRLVTGEKVLKTQGISEAGLKTFRAAAASMKFPDNVEGALIRERGMTWIKAAAKGDEADAAMRATDDAVFNLARGGQSAAESLAEQTADITARNVERDQVGWWARKFNPAAGAKDVHQAMLKNVSYHQQETTAFRKWMTELSRQFSPQELDEAMGLIRSGQGDTTNKAFVALKKAFDETTRAMDLPEDIVAGQSIAARGGLTMKEINRELRRQGAKNELRTYAYDALNKKVDLSDGTKFLSSAHFWEGDVLENLSHIRAAVEQAMVARGFMHDAASHFGRLERGGEHVYKLTGPGTESVANHYFTKDIANQMGVALKNLEDLRQPHSPIRKVAEQAMAEYKTIFTIDNPRHHMLNNIGNTFLNWMGGVNNPLMYKKAAKATGYLRSMMKDFDNITDSYGPGALARDMKKNSNPAEIILQSKKLAGKNTRLSTQQLVLASKQYGILIGAHSAEDIGGVSRTLTGRLPLLKHWEAAGRWTSETTENFSRFAMFIDQLSKHKGVIDDAAFHKAASWVRKFHPDGTDLTDFERRNMRLIFPFYSWMRKAVPLMVEGIVYNPKKIMVIPKGQAAIATMMGFDPGTFADPFPADQAWPDWIRESGIGPTFAPGMKLPFMPKFEGYGISDPQLPPTAVGELVSGSPVGTLKRVAGMTSPLGRMPVELVRGKTFYDDKKIWDKSQYFTKNLPGTAQYAQMTGRDPLGGNEPMGAGYYLNEKTGSPTNKMGIANWLLGLGISDTGPGAKQGKKDEKKRRESA